MLLFYIRHGDPIYNPDSLTPLGKRQAEAVAKRLAKCGIDKIYSSTSQRAYETAIPTSEILGKEITKLDFANESHAWEDIAVKDADGATRWAYQNSIIQKLFLNQDVLNLCEKWYEHPAFSEYNFKKGIDRINKATDDFILQLGYEHDRETHTYIPVCPNNDRVALFAHEGFGTEFLSSLLDIPLPYYSMHFGMTHTGVTVIDFHTIGERTYPKILTLSNDSHLYNDDLPTGYCNIIRY